MPWRARSSLGERRKSGQPRERLATGPVIGKARETRCAGRKQDHIPRLCNGLGPQKAFTQIDGETWSVVYVVVDTKSWKPGRQVLAPPTWIEAVSWSERRIHFRVSRQKIKTSQRIARGMHTSA